MGIGMLLIFTGLMVHQFEAMIVKHYGKKYGDGGMFFNAIICIFSMLYFLITDKGGLQFPPRVILLGLINSTMYATGFYAAYVAYRVGSFGLTRLFSSFGSIIPIMYGILFLHEPTSIFTYIAIVLIFLSVFLMKFRKNTDEEKAHISLKWMIFLILTVLSNALIAIIGRIQVGAFGGEYKNEFLMISLAGAAVSLFVLGFILERDKFRATIKSGLLYGMFAGMFNGINNLLILVTYSYVPISISSPIKTGLGMIISFLVSVLLYKEKFSRRQLVSVAIGIVTVVLINLKF